MKSNRAIIAVSALGVIAAGLGFLAWNRAPSTLERRMLQRTDAFLEAIVRRDQLALLRQTVSSEELLASMEEITSPDNVEAITVVPSKAASDGHELEIYALLDWKYLNEVSSRFNSPVTFGVNTTPANPSITFSFDCNGAQGRCMEHAIFFYSSHAKKIGSYSPFWNDSMSRELWKSNYEHDRVQQPCDSRCPRYRLRIEPRQ